MNSKPTVSIIIPVYNVEKYLDKCLDSVVNQTYTNLEIILVDDGSHDNCPAICNQWRSRDSRIKVIHQENGGLSHARNEGLKIATGEFIGFVDSDDWIEPEMYEVLLDTMMETGADIAICGSLNESEDSSTFIQKPKSPTIKIYPAEKALELLISGKSSIRNAVWNKLFRKHFLKNIPFQVGKIYEDMLWTPQVIGSAQTVVTIDLPLYHYLYRSESLSHDVHNLYHILRDESEMYEQRIQYIHEQYPALEDLAIAQYQILCCYNYKQVSLKYRQFDSDGSIRQIIHDSFCKWSWSKNLALGNYKVGIGCLIFRFCPRLLPPITVVFDTLGHILHKLKTETNRLIKHKIGFCIYS
jgi:glycosyltransferase involved in cell wall biosynthesis